MGPLSGLKVLDFSRLLPGPLCTHLLVRLGASVVKVESPSGDYARDIPPLIRYAEKVKHSAFYEALNGEKKNINVDLKNDEQVQLIRKLIRSYDVVVEGNRPGVMDRLGLGYESLKVENPGLIFCSISGYGSTGPFSQRAGHDVNYMATAGLLEISGKVNTVPPLVGYQGADVVGAIQAVIGIQAALLERTKTGEGQFVDISLCESAMILGISALSQGLAGGLVERGKGHLDGGLPNYNIYETADNKYISVGALEPHFWSKFCKFLKADHLVKGSTDEVKAFIASKTYDEWVALSKECDACVEPSLGLHELMHHPQHVAREVFLQPESSQTQLPPQVVLGPRLSNHAAKPLARAAYHGEHNDELLKSLGYSTYDGVKSCRSRECKMRGPLDGIKVLDFSRLLPGPLSTHLLVRLGAEVVKIEAPDGDYARFVPPLISFNGEAEHSNFFECLNGGKRNIVLDFKVSEHREAIRRLASHYDVIVEGNRPGVMDRLGLAYQDLKKDNPGLIYCSLSGYGSTGPYAQRAGHDINYMALAGLLEVSGKPGSVPPLVGFQGADISGALQAVVGIEAALLERTKTGEGQFVDISLCESAMILGISALSQGLAGGLVERGKGHLDGGLPNYNIYETADNKYISVGALEPHFWSKFCKFLKADHLVKGSTDEVKAFIASKTYDEWVALSKECDACVEPSLGLHELMHHPQHVAREVFLQPESSQTQLPPQVVLGPRLSNHAAKPLARAAYHGEHNVEVLREIGYGETYLKKIFPLYKSLLHWGKFTANQYVMSSFYKSK